MEKHIISEKQWQMLKQAERQHRRWNKLRRELAACDSLKGLTLGDLKRQREIEEAQTQATERRAQVEMDKVRAEVDLEDAMAEASALVKLREMLTEASASEQEWFWKGVEFAETAREERHKSVKTKMAKIHRMFPQYFEEEIEQDIKEGYDEQAY